MNIMSKEVDEDEEVILRDVAREERLKRITELMLELKKGMMEDFHIDSHTSVPQEEKGIGRTKISRRTREQADKVRVFLEFYYTLIEKYTKPPPGEEHRDVDNVYNPLQVIRNRKIRKKYGDKTRDFHLARPPVIAIKDFSHRSSKFPWYVDIMEKSNDIVWRTNHWDELKRPDGSLWFGKKLHRQHSHPHMHQPPHQFIGHWSKNSVVSSGSSGENSYNEDISAGNSRSLLSRFSRGATRRPEPLEGFTQNNNDSKMVVPKIIYQTPTENGNGKTAIIDVPIDPLKKPDEEQDSKPGRLEPELEQNQEDEQYQEQYHDQGDQLDEQQPDHLELEHLRQQLSLPSQTQSLQTKNSPKRSNGLYPTHSSTSSTKHSKANSLSLSHSNQPSSSVDLQSFIVEESIRRKLYEDYRSIKCLECSWEVLRRKRVLTELAAKRRMNVTAKKLRANVRSLKHEMNLTESLLGSYEAELSTDGVLLSEFKTKFLKDYSNRVNSLISFSDRFLSDINTTLTLRLRILKENIDKVSLLSHQKRAWRKGLYKALEVFIVSCLWFVWLVFSILRIVQNGLIIVFKIVKWALF